jgi:hypothetical protein
LRHIQFIKHLVESALAGLLAVSAAWAGFLPSVRVDRENRPNYGCFHAAVTLAPAPAGSQPVYAVIQDDSMEGMVSIRSDIIFQKSTDGGATWLPQDVLIKRGSVFACYPDVATDSQGAIYVVYTEGTNNLHSHIYCVRSTDAGTTWSTPVTVDDNSNAVPIGWARIVADSAGNLFAAWNGNQTGRISIWSAVSTDRGATWSPNVQVDDDTVPSGCYHTDVAVQPGTNSPLVVASAPYWSGPGQIRYHAYLYRSTDMGQSFRPGVQLDTFDNYTGQPHVVADAQHIICDYTGSTQASGNQSITESRTLYTPPDTWGRRASVTKLDTLYSCELNGANLALSADGRVHIALMVFDLVSRHDGIFYASSSDHGASWSDRERVNDDSVDNQSDPDIAVDSAGFACMLWQDGRNSREEIWFSTNNPLGVAEDPTPRAASPHPPATIVRGELLLPASSVTRDASSVLLDLNGRRVIGLHPGASDVSGLAPGVYFVRQQSAVSSQHSGAVGGKRLAVSVRKVIVTR